MSDSGDSALLAFADGASAEGDTVSSALALKIAARHASIGIQCPMASTQMCATIEARGDAPNDEESRRAPVDIVVALDRSGSMQGAKLGLCLKTLELLLRELGPRDRFGLVTFSDHSTIDIPLRKLIPYNKTLAVNRVRTVRPGGYTNISAAIGTAAQEMHAIEEPNQVRAIFLLSDGLANRGISDSNEIVSLARLCLDGTGGPNASRPPIAVHTFGYGSGHDQVLLRSVSAVTSGGMYYFVDAVSSVPAAFGDALGGMLSVVAQNVTLVVSVPKEAAERGVEIVRVHNDNAKRFGSDFLVSLGDLYSGECRDVLFEVALTRRGGGTSSTTSDGGGPVPHIVASLSFKDAISRTNVTGIEAAGVVSRPNDKGVSDSNYRVSVQLLRIRTTTAMEEARDLASRHGASRSDLAAAREKVEACLSDLRMGASGIRAKADPLIVQMIADLNDAYAGLENEVSYEAYGKNRLDHKLQTHRLQRCSETYSNRLCTYRNPKKTELSGRFANWQLERGQEIYPTKKMMYGISSQ